MSTLRVAGIAGSLRRGSLNRALLAAAAELAPADVEIVPVEIGALPLYDEDLDTDAPPGAVARLRAALAAADALLVATPEFNHNIPGVLQNALDWASRPAFASALRGLPAGMMGAASGSIGTARAQEALKLVLLAVQAPVFPHRGVLVGGARAKFADGRLVHAPTREFVAGYLSEFAAWARAQPRTP